MATESGADVHHDAPRCLLGLFDAPATGLADWSVFDAEVERWGIEVRGLSRQSLTALIKSSTRQIPTTRHSSGALRMSFGTGAATCFLRGRGRGCSPSRGRCPSRKSWSTAPTRTALHRHCCGSDRGDRRARETYSRSQKRRPTRSMSNAPTVNVACIRGVNKTKSPTLAARRVRLHAPLRFFGQFQKECSREIADAQECYTGILSLASISWHTNSEEARMGLSRYKGAAGVAVSDMERARNFYEEKLGLSVGIDSGDNVQYRCWEGTMFPVYLSPEHAGNSTATLAGASMISRES
jgi:hypothetical protein